MEDKKDVKPKLDYEQVVEFIDERIIRIEQAAEQMEAESRNVEAERKRAPCCLSRCWKKWCECMKRCCRKK